jgi:hypothetical protein
MLLTVGGAISVAVAAFLVVYFVLFPTSSPKPFKLSATPAGSANASPSSAAPKASPSSVAGTWKVASGSMAGYRVREKLGFLGGPERRRRAHIADDGRRRIHSIQRQSNDPHRLVQRGR